MIVIVLIILLTTIGYYFLKRNYQYWEKKGVTGPKPTLLLGNLEKCFFLKASTGEAFSEVYHKYQNEEMVGMYRATTPVLLIRDPDLIKEVTVKSFHHFRDNDVDVDRTKDALFGRDPFVLKGDEWKEARAQITPGFTSGKMKALFPLLEEVCTNLVKLVDSRPGEVLEAQELARRYTLNTVATCGFGLEGKCLEEENSSFRQLANEFLAPGGWALFSLFLMTFLPGLAKFLSLPLITKSVQKKIIDMVIQTLEYRKENNIVRNDYLQVMSQLKHDDKCTDLDVIAHAATFFIEGFEKGSIIISFALFELASSEESQKKLREELRRTFEENGEKLPYDVLQALPYLDGVVNETLRKRPAITTLLRTCTKSFTYTPKSKGKPVVIEKGTPVALSIYGLHYDPKYYEDPEVFKPERFIGRNKEKITKYTFLPFGEGPRSCLGQRFAMLQVKAGIAYVVHNFELSVNKKTQLPIKYEPTNSLIAPVGGLWLDFKKMRIVS